MCFNLYVWVWVNADPYCIFSIGAPFYLRQKQECDPFSISATPLLAILLEYTKMSKISIFINVVLWCTVWEMNVKSGRVKEKPGLSISRLIKGATRFNVPIWQINHNSTFALTTYALRKDLGFNPGIFGVETCNWSSAPPSHLVRGRNLFIKNFYSARDQIRDCCMWYSGSVSAPQQKFKF